MKWNTRQWQVHAQFKARFTLFEISLSGKCFHSTIIFVSIQTRNKKTRI